tara:strand:+ start:569 stop:859 length:291 start_codon:yes stop_codon:yes gene_type:complete
MKQVKCPACAAWYDVDSVLDKFAYQCSYCRAPYLVKTKKQLEHEEEMKAPVSNPPLVWKHWGDMHWLLVIVNNIGVVIQTIIFAIATIIGILLAPL